MKFSEAMEALQKGSKVTRQQWLGSIYFLVDGKDVKTYQPKLSIFNYDEDIMVSDGWKVEGVEGEFKFYEIIDYLNKGKKAKLSDWKEAYIKYDANEKYLFHHVMDVFPYRPDFAAFMANDWIIIE